MLRNIPFADILSRVSMLVMGHPQFETQNDVGIGDGIPPISEWQIERTFNDNDMNGLLDVEINDEVMNVFVRLRNVFQRANRIPFPATQLHDLTCFVVHRLLLSTAESSVSSISPMTECIRYAIIIYLFTVQGPTYYSHATMMNTMVTNLMQNFEKLESTSHKAGILDLWLSVVGMVASTETAHYTWFSEMAKTTVTLLNITNAQDVFDQIKSVLWLDLPRVECIFHLQCEALTNTESHPDGHLRAGIAMNSMATSLL